MTRIISLRHLIAASGLAAAAALAMAGSSTQASAGVSQCRGSSPLDVRKCCAQQVKEDGLPMWMRDAHMTCNSAAMVCKSSGGGWKPIAVAAVAPAGIKKCKIKVVHIPIPKDSHEPKDTNDGGANYPTHGKP